MPQLCAPAVGTALLEDMWKEVRADDHRIFAMQVEAEWQVLSHAATDLFGPKTLMVQGGSTCGSGKGREEAPQALFLGQHLELLLLASASCFACA